MSFVPRHVIVAFENGVDAAKLLADLGLAMLSHTPHFTLVKVPLGEEDAWIEKLKQQPGVKNAFRNRLHENPRRTLPRVRRPSK